MKILTICPTKYPDKLNRMIESFDMTKSEHTDLIFSSHGNVTEAINLAFNSNPDYDFYHITNDDVIYKTEEWDIKLANTNKISYGNDLLQGDNLCTFPMIDGDIARALGWLQLPTLEKYCGDVVWKFIGKETKCLSYHGNIFIKHEWSNDVSREIHEKDQLEFSKWLPWSFKDINKVREVINKKEN